MHLVFNNVTYSAFGCVHPSVHPSVSALWILRGTAVASFAAPAALKLCVRREGVIFSGIEPPTTVRGLGCAGGGVVERVSAHHHHLSLSREGRWGTTDDFATSFLHFSLFSTAIWDLANFRPAHSLMLSSHLFLYLPRLLPPFTVPCKMVLARPGERET